ncbi:MAG: right-handed parallel beta-helix repeat-containing protein [Bacteroidetes bacterium]|nr:right-handed parallel beta-helix repeat-containing protein [Bacteroidota bacterium]
MRKEFIYLLSVVFTILQIPMLLCAQTTFFVSPLGNDEWSGKFSDPVKNQTDGPFRTLEKAKQAVEALDENTLITDNEVKIFLRKGVYKIEQPLFFSGKTGNERIKGITFSAYKNESVHLTGGKEIKGFHSIKDPGILKRINPLYRSKILQVDLKNSGITDFGKIINRGGPALELFFNGKKMEPARWPNEGWVKIADVPQNGLLVFKGDAQNTRFGTPSGRHYGRFTYSGNRPSNWSDTKNIVLHGYWVWDWYDEYLNILSIDTTAHEIFIKPPHSNYGYCKEQRYYAANVLEELDRPGEWYIDRSSGLLLFWPPSSINEADVFVSLQQKPLIELDHTSRIRIERLSFDYSQGSAIVIKEGENNLVAGCTFSNLGDIAVRIEGGTNNGISSCDMHDLALGGIVVSGGDRKTLAPAGNYVINNNIHDFAQWIRTYQPGIIISGVGNRISNNLIYNGPGTGILLSGNEHIIEYNEMHDLALETGDVGAFYMGRDWTERGNIIRYNYFHDLKGQGKHDVNAVYLDDWASGSIVEGNIFNNCARGIMIGGGRDNIVSNNIFTGCHVAIHVDSRGLGWAKYYFDGTDSTLFKRMDAMNYNKPPYSVKYPVLLSLYGDEPAIAKNNRIFSNISYSGRWMDLLDKLDFTIVQSRDNIIGKPDEGPLSNKDFIVKNNPGIYDADKRDFRIKPEGYKHGFNGIDYKKIGLQKDTFRPEPLKSFRY